MNNADMPAMPLTDSDGIVQSASGAWAHGYTNECTGLTKREELAARAMQGLLSGSYCINDPVNRTAGLAFEATCIADALLTELEKDQ